MGASKLIGQMEWWNGLTEWIDFSDIANPSSQNQFTSKNSIARIRHYALPALALQSGYSNWFQTVGEQFDWGDGYILHLYPHSRDPGLADGVGNVGLCTRSSNPNRGFRSATLDANLPYYTSAI